MIVNSNGRYGRRNQSTQGTSTKTCYRCSKKGHTSKDCRTDKEKLYCKFCKAKGHASEACKKQKAKNNGNHKSGNMHKARQITDTASPNLTDNESNDHKVGRTIVMCSDDYKAFFSILLTHEGSHREAYRDFQPSLTSSAGGAKG